MRLANPYTLKTLLNVYDAGAKANVRAIAIISTPYLTKANNKWVINEIINKINISVADTTAFLFYNSFIITTYSVLAVDL